MKSIDIPLQQQVQELLQFVYLMPVAIIKLGVSGDIAMLNPMAVQLLANLDIDPCALDGPQVLDALSPGLGALWAASGDKTGQICEPIRSSFFADSARAIHLVVSVVRPDRHCTMVSVEDVTTTVQRERELYLNRQQLGLVLERIEGYCVAMLDAQGNVTEWNPSIDRMFGASVTDRVGRPLAEFLSPTDRSSAFQHFSVVAGRVAEHGLFRCETPLQHTSGDVLWGELVVTPTVSADGAVSGYVVVVRDISEQRHTQQRLFDAAMTDPLTALLNRRGLEDSLERLPHSADSSRSVASWIMIDIDHFKRVNDTYGHDAGDTILKHVAALVKTCARGGDIVARLGGEEFVVVLPAIALTPALAAAERIRARIEGADIMVDGQRLKVTASFGVCTQERGTAASEAMRAADDALYQAKAAGRNCVVSCGVTSATVAPAQAIRA